MSLVVVYRLGGTKNFRWQASLALDKRSEAVALRDRVRLSGRPAFIEPASRFESLGPPSTFDAMLRQEWQLFGKGVRSGIPGHR